MSTRPGNSGTRKPYGATNSGTRNNLSKNSRNSSGGPSANRQGSGARPIPSYMKPTGGMKSNERSGGSLNRKSPANKLPSNYKPPHLRNNFVGTNNRNNSGPRVSPGVPRTGVQKQSPGVANRFQNKPSVSPGVRQYGKNYVSPNRPGGGISNLGGQVNL